MYTALFSIGALNEIIAKFPENTPAHPRPAIALPTIKAVEDGATPQIKLPTSNIPSESKKDLRTSKCANTRPKIGWKAQEVRRYAEPYLKWHELSVCSKEVPTRRDIVSEGMVRGLCAVE